VVTAPKPPQPIEKGVAGPGLLAHVITAKYVQHLPLYRQEESFARQNVLIRRSTLAGWMFRAIAACQAESGKSRTIWKLFRNSEDFFFQIASSSDWQGASTEEIIQDGGRAPIVLPRGGAGCSAGAAMEDGGRARSVSSVGASSGGCGANRARELRADEQLWIKLGEFEVFGPGNT
jgi:hypothetical protein